MKILQCKKLGKLHAVDFIKGMGWEGGRGVNRTYKTNPENIQESRALHEKIPKLEVYKANTIIIKQSKPMQF